MDLSKVGLLVHTQVSITLSRGEIFGRRRLFFYVWTDENGFEFGIRRRSYIIYV